MNVHHLKTHPGPFGDVWMDRKRYEIRKDDRAFRVGDTLLLQEWTPAQSHDESKLGEGGYSGRKIVATVIHKTEGGAWGLPADLCVLGLMVLERQGAMGR